MNKYTYEGMTYEVFPCKDGKGHMVKINSAPPIFVDAQTDDEALRAFGVEVGFVTLVNVENKPAKIVKTETLPRGRKVFQHNNNPIPVEPVPVIVVEER